jgi:type VI protein secretion system component VasK
MLLVAIIVWAVAVGGCFIYAAVSGLRTFRRVRAAQATLEGRIAALQAEGVGRIEHKTAELHEKMAAMQAALARLERSMAGLRVLTESVSTATTVLFAVRRIVRR